MITGKILHIVKGKKQFFFNLDEIALVSVLKNDCFFYLTDGRTEKVTMPLKDVMDKIEEFGGFENHHFVFVGRSAIINTNRVERIDKANNKVIIRTNKHLPLDLSDTAIETLHDIMKSQSSVPPFKTAESPVVEIDNFDMLNYGGLIPSSHSYVDLGLPSKTLWAKLNMYFHSCPQIKVYPETNIYDPDSVFDDCCHIYGYDDDDICEVYEAYEAYLAYTKDEENEDAKKEYEEKCECANLFLLEVLTFMKEESWDPEHWVEPTREQWQELIDLCQWIPYVYNSSGHKGYGFLIKGPNGKYLDLPAGGWDTNASFLSFTNKYQNRNEINILKFNIDIRGVDVHIETINMDDLYREKKKPEPCFIRLVYEKHPEKNVVVSAYNYKSFANEDAIPKDIKIMGLARFCGSSIKSITIPKGIVYIKNSTFESCSLLTQVNIPSTVTTIENSAFKGCTSLQHITIPDSVESIGDMAFKDCSSLQEITIPRNVKTFGNETFVGCDSLRKVTIKGAESIGYRAFWHCKSLREIHLPKNLKIIDARAFNGLDSLRSIRIESAERIEVYVFHNCVNLQDVYLPDNLVSIRDTAFEGCTSLRHIYVKASMMSKVMDMLPEEQRCLVSAKP